jgi:hypothetical protein
LASTCVEVAPPTYTNSAWDGNATISSEGRTIEADSDNHQTAPAFASRVGRLVCVIGSFLNAWIAQSEARRCHPAGQA